MAALGAPILAAAIGKDDRLPFECDEMFTYYNTKAAGLSELWTLPSTGGFDGSPPVYTLAAWQAQRLVRDDHLALRLPATVTRRVPTAVGAAGGIAGHEDPRHRPMRGDAVVAAGPAQGAVVGDARPVDGPHAGPGERRRERELLRRPPGVARPGRRRDAEEPGAP